jgi:hypothetical protein
LNLDFYQSYDKALDNYYLTLAYISTLRNWTNLFSFKVSRFLFYFRLVGAVAFELSGIRAVLLIFPNTFEYFFDFYELVRLRWDPRRLNRETVLRAAALIVGSRWLLTHRLPPADHRPRLAADPIPAHVAERSARIAAALPALRLTDPARRGRTWGSSGREIMVLAVANTGLVVLYAALLPTRAGSIDIRQALLFSLLLTLIVTLYDRYRPIHIARFENDPWALQARRMASQAVEGR